MKVQFSVPLSPSAFARFFFYQSWPSTFHLAGVSKGFQPGAGSNFFKIPFSVPFKTASATLGRKSLRDCLVMRFLPDSALSAGVSQGSTP